MTTPLRVALLLYPHCMPAGLFAFADLLHAANRRTGRNLFETRFVALQAGTVACAQGVSMSVTERLDQARFDAILLPGFWAESAQHVDDTIAANTSLVSALSMCPAKRQLWSYCSGVGLLAASGQLKDQAATVTWWLADAMAQRHKNVNWQIERTCIMNVHTATASGVNGYLPIAQALIERHVSAAVLRDLVKLMVLPRPAQPHVAFQAMSLIEQSSRLRRSVHALIEQLPADQVTVQRLASQLHLSQRTLARQVRGEVGLAVATYARHVKLNQVSERLIFTTTPLNAISAELGFSSDSNMRRMFKALTSLTPMQYRQRFARL